MIFAVLFFLLGLLFFVAAFHPDAVAAGQTTGRILIGAVLAVAGGFMIYLSRIKPVIQKVEVHQSFEAPGELNLQEVKCRQCGAQLSAKEMKIVSGAAVISCPYCDAAYHLEEEPKW